jgi:hypothetical protein
MDSAESLPEDGRFVSIFPLKRDLLTYMQVFNINLQSWSQSAGISSGCMIAELSLFFPEVLRSHCLKQVYVSESLLFV